MRNILSAFILLLGAWTVSAVRSPGDNLTDRTRFPLNRFEKRARQVPRIRALAAFTEFNEQTGGRWNIRFDARTGSLSALSGGGTAPRPGSGLEAAAAHLEQLRPLTEIDPGQLKLEKTIAEGGLSHILYRQSYKGIPVEFSRVKVHVDRDGSLLGINSSFEPRLDMDIRPDLSSEAAFESVRRELGVISSRPGELVLFPDEQSGQARLAWKYSLRLQDRHWKYYVDADTGQVLFRFDDLRHQACVTSGVVQGLIYDVDPTSTPARTRVFANQRVFVKDGSNYVVTGGDGRFCSGEKGKIITSLQGPFVNVSNFSGPSAHYDNGLGVWNTIGTTVSSPSPYLNNTIHITTINLSGTAADAAVKFLPIFSSFKVGTWLVDSDGFGDIGDDDQVSVVDQFGFPVGAYLGDRTPFNGAAVHGKQLRLKLRSNESGVYAGYTVSVSSYLTLTAPGEWNVNGSSVYWKPEMTLHNKRSEINLFYHLNSMHDYFMSDVNKSSHAYIGNPVNAIAFLGPNSGAIFYSPEHDNLNFGDINSTDPSDAVTDDATVPRHEYAHYVMDKVWYTQNFGQAGAISEAMADYFSATSLNISGIGRYYNNSFGGPAVGPLRELDCPGQTTCSVYSSANWRGEIHDDSLFLSQALWKIRTDRITQQGQTNGRSCADGLVFQALLWFPESFAEFYDAMRRVDSRGLVPNCNPGFSAVNAAQAHIDSAFARHALPGPVGDAYERNDGFETAVDVSTISSLQATISPGADTDFYAFGAGAGKIRATLTLPPDGNFYKGYAMTLFDRQHRVAVAVAQPVFDFNSFSATHCHVDDCNTSQSKVVLDFSTTTAQYYYLRVSGGPTFGDLIGTGSNSAVNSLLPYTLEISYPPHGAVAADVVSAAFDQDKISFSVSVTTYVRTQNLYFAYAQLRDQSLRVLAETKAVPCPPASCSTPPAASYLTFLSSQSAAGVVSGQLQLAAGFAERFPSVGTVHLEVFAYNVLGSTYSLGLSQAINLTSSRAALTVWNNIIDPTKGGRTTVKYETLKPGRVVLQVFTLSGALVKTLYDDTVTSGKGSVEWDGKNSSGRFVSSGIYLLHLSGPGISKTQKIAVIK